MRFNTSIKIIIILYYYNYNIYIIKNVYVNNIALRKDITHKIKWDKIFLILQEARNF